MEASSSPSKVKSPTKLSQINPAKRRQYTEVKQGEFAVELWWIPPTHVRLHDVKSLRTTTLLGEIVGVFDCSYEEDDMSEVERLQSVTYEVEVVLKDSVFKSFFGFRKQEQVRFEVSAESLWSSSLGSELATAYELYFYAEQGYWGVSMTHDRLQQVNRMVLEKVREVRILGDEPTEENCELAHVWLRAVAKLASTQIQQCEISDLLREVRDKKTEARLVES